MVMPEGFEVVGAKSSDVPQGFEVVPEHRKINSFLEFANKIAQGATFGFGDEISAAMAGGLAAATGGNFRDAYEYSLGHIRDNMEEFERQHPGLAAAAEIGGAITTGGIGGAKLLGGKTLEGASAAAKYGAISGLGAAEGGLYGAGTAEGERMLPAIQGALIGAVAAPVGTKVTDWLLKGGKTAASFVGRKLSDTP